MLLKRSQLHLHHSNGLSKSKPTNRHRLSRHDLCPLNNRDSLPLQLFQDSLLLITRLIHTTPTDSVVHLQGPPTCLTLFHSAYNTQCRILMPILMRELIRISKHTEDPALHSNLNLRKVAILCANLSTARLLATILVAVPTSSQSHHTMINKLDPLPKVNSKLQALLGLSPARRQFREPPPWIRSGKPDLFHNTGYKVTRTHRLASLLSTTLTWLMNNRKLIGNSKSI